MSKFDYRTAAGLYVGTRYRGTGGLVYKRFETAAEAVRFAIEQMPVKRLRGSVLEVDDARFSEQQIRMLYDAAEYPLNRGEPLRLV